MAKRNLTSDSQDYLETLGFEATAYFDPTQIQTPSHALIADIADPIRGEGNLQARIVFVGEDEVVGNMLQGPTGQLLNKMIDAMGLKRDEIYLASIRQVNNELSLAQILRDHLKSINPQIVVAMGDLATQLLLETDAAIGELRMEAQTNARLSRANGELLKIFVTYHPAFCLKNPSMKKPVWEDLQKVMHQMNL